MKQLQNDNLLAVLYQAAESGKSDVFEITLGSGSLRRTIHTEFLAEYDASDKSYSHLADMRLSPEEHCWMECVDFALRGDHYDVVEVVMRHGTVKSSISHLFRHLSGSINYLSLGCVKHIVTIIVSRDDWLFEETDDVIKLDEKMSGDADREPDAAENVELVPAKYHPFQTIWRLESPGYNMIRRPVPKDALTEIIPTIFRDRRVQSRFWNQLLTCPFWNIFLSDWGPLVLETVPCSEYAAMLICNLLFQTLEDGGNVEYDNVSHSLNDLDIPHMRLVAQYLNDDPAVRTLVLKQVCYERLGILGFLLRLPILFRQTVSGNGKELHSAHCPGCLYQRISYLS